MPARARLRAIVAGLCASLALGACGSGGATTPTTAAPTTTPAVQVLSVTPALRAALLAAGAAAHGLTSVDYTGLAAGLTYYAYDTTTAEYWAGARLVPSPDSQAALVASQDDGSYDVFVKTTGHGWTAYADGLGGRPDATCAIVVPLPVRLAWGWSLSTPCGVPPGT